MGKFFQDKICVYLDQFAVSNLSEDPSWNEILQILEKGLSENKIIIPYSSEHLFESSHKDFEKAEIVDKLLFKMSNGLTLEIAPKLIVKYLISAIRKRPINTKLYTITLENNVFADKEKYDQFKTLKTTFNKMSYEGTALVNKIRDATRSTRNLDISDVNKSIHRTATIYQQELGKRLNKFSRYGFFDTKPIKFSMATIPFWADYTMSDLISEYELTKKEAKKGEEILNKKGIKAIIPPLYIRCALETMMAVKHQKESPNDHLDILRLSTAIPFADIVLTDKSKVFDIKNSSLDKDYMVEVFSGSQDGLEQFKKRLIEYIL